MKAVDLFAHRGWASFDARVSVLANGCHVWMGHRNSRGYGVVAKELRGVRYRLLAHRVNYERHVGPIPLGLTLDHTCRNTSCVNPAHLEPVTRTENTRRQMSAIHGSDPGRVCKRGHRGEYRIDPKSLKLWCKGCHRDRARELAERRAS
ncbi:MAG TPA: HNH endonuclease signature motif containing protein [Candidatus Limnocylindria bacterium]|nr:HNH endonuclease signature motif containing protein [Candidatus Limnocylindria bacterium]